MPQPRARDEEFTGFVEQHSTALLRYCWLLTGNQSDADDLLQASLLKLYLHWDRVEHPEARVRYVKQVIARHHVSVWRRVGRRERVLAELPDVGVPADDPGDRDELWRALTGLGERQRTVLVLRFYEDLDEKSIADVMGISIGTVKSQLSRGLGHLRARLDEARPADPATVPAPGAHQEGALR